MSKSPLPVERIPYRRPDGSMCDVIVPRTRIDVEQQSDIPAAVLACVALAPVVHGHHAWSRFTLQTLYRLASDFGDDVLRLNLCSLLTEIEGGFRPLNPIGLFIHRVRTTPTQSTLA